MLKVQHREEIISNVRQYYCIRGPRRGNQDASTSSAVIRSFKQVESLPSPTSSTAQHEEKVEEVDNNVNQQLEEKIPYESREFIKRLNKITKDSYGKRRKRPPLSDQLNDLSIHVASLDMEWNDVKTVLRTIKHFRLLLSLERNPPIGEVILSGAVPYLLQYLDLKQIQKFFNIDLLDDNSGKRSLSLSELHRLQFEASWAITNIVSGSPDHTRYVVELDCIPIMIELLDSESDEVKQQSVWALGNISGDSAEMRDLVLHHGSLPKILKILECDTNDGALTQYSAWTLSNLLRGKPAPPWEIVSTALPVLSNLLSSVDDVVLMDTCWAISCLCDGSDEHIQAVIDQGITSRVVQLLQHDKPEVQSPAVRIVGNLVTGTDIQTSIVLNCGVLCELSKLLEHPTTLIRKSVLWTLSNISAGNIDQVQMVIESDVVPKVISIIKSGSESFEVANEGYWVLINLFENGNKKQIKYVLEKGVVQLFCNGLKEDPKIIKVSLEGLDSLITSQYQKISESVSSHLEEYGGLAIISELVNHEQDAISNLASRILKYHLGPQYSPSSPCYSPVSNNSEVDFQPNNFY